MVIAHYIIHVLMWSTRRPTRTYRSTNRPTDRTIVRDAKNSPQPSSLIQCGIGLQWFSCGGFSGSLQLKREKPFFFLFLLFLLLYISEKPTHPATNTTRHVKMCSFGCTCARNVLTQKLFHIHRSLFGFGRGKFAEKVNFIFLYI